MRTEGYQIPQVEFVFRENGEFVTRTSAPKALADQYLNMVLDKINEYAR
jgi:hypothetical protein